MSSIHFKTEILEKDILVVTRTFLYFRTMFSNNRCLIQMTAKNWLITISAKNGVRFFKRLTILEVAVQKIPVQKIYVFS